MFEIITVHSKYGRSYEKKVIAIFGYNNTRLYDVKKIKAMAVKHDVDIMLCKEDITDADRSVSQYCFDTKLHGTSAEIEAAYQKFLTWVQSLSVEVIGILPFSDKGILLGSYAATKLGIPSDDYACAIRGLDKFLFREAEAKTELPNWYKKPAFQFVKSEQDIVEFYSRLQRPVFVKPAAEGNSRGCMLVESEQDIPAGFAAIAPYMQDGGIIEEYIANAREFSADSVGDYHWVTEKETTTGAYRAEIQQIVPAPLPREQYERLIEAGKAVSELSGRRGGASHNEIFLLTNNDTVTVEPNRRPAGMHIWDLAAVAFESFNPFEQWIEWALGKQTATHPLHVKEYAGIRMVPANTDGIISQIQLQAIRQLHANPGVIEIQISKKVGDKVSKNPSDNAGFIGFVIAKHTNPHELKKILKATAQQASNALSIEENYQEEKHPVATKIRNHASHEQVITLDCTYLSPVVDHWLQQKLEVGDLAISDQNKRDLVNLLLANFKNNEAYYFDKVGTPDFHISGIMMLGVFSLDNASCAELVHETLSDMFHIRDIKYPYESHKYLYVKQAGLNKSEWGNGAGTISPHADDLYEDCETDYLSLTTCRDKFNIPTLFYMLKQIIHTLSDEELESLTRILPLFISGTNVQGAVKQKARPIVALQDNNVFMSLDFRVDAQTGVRMRTDDINAAQLLQKIKSHLDATSPMRTVSQTGSFVILANRKVLHAREALPVEDRIETFNLSTTPRLLFRSKGPRQEPSSSIVALGIK